MQQVHVLLDAPDDRVDAAIELADRTARHHVELGEQWMAGEGEGEESEDGRLVWRDDLEVVVALLLARGGALAPLVARARAVATIEVDLSELSPLQSAVLARLATIDASATILTERGDVLARGEAAGFPAPTDPPRRVPSYDGGVDAELFRALSEQGLLEVGASFDAVVAAASWAVSGRAETGEALMEWLLDRADVEEVHASEDDLERAMAYRW